MAEGIDVYTKYQQVTDFYALARTRQFCYVKTSDGGATRDTASYGPRGRQAGVKMGGYHYAQPGSPEGQADLFITACESGWLLDLAPALDLEDPFTPGPDAADFAIRFLKRVRSKGHRPCLYGNNAMLFGPNGIAAAVRAAVPDVLVWCARYGGDPSGDYDVHQYSDKGTVSGVAGTVDTNRGVLPLNQLPTSNGGFADMSDAYPTPKVLPDGTYRYHVSCANWNKVNGRYVALSTGFSGCSFQVWMQLADGSYVDSPDDIPSGSWGRVLKGTLAPDNVHWLGIPAGAQSVSVDIKPSTADGVPGLTLFTDGK